MGSIPPILMRNDNNLKEWRTSVQFKMYRKQFVKEVFHIATNPKSMY